MTSASSEPAPSAGADPMVGTEIAAGRYVIDGPLGRGGMGRVYLATDRHLSRQVALKFLHEELDDTVARERFLREARAAAALAHPNACRLYEVGEHEGDAFLVMEVLDGELLSERIGRGPLPPAAALDVALPLMSAVTALHEAGLIHRDLKPANVMLTPQGVKLLDFGLARHTAGAMAMTMPTLTGAGAVTGTLRYMAPEQVTGDPVDERTDIFALGVILYEMLTGRIPFAAETNVDWLRAVLHDEPQGLGDPALAALESVVRRALQRRLVDRYASVAEMAAAVSAAAAREPAAEGAAPVMTGSLVVAPFHVLQDDAVLAVLQHGAPEAITAALANRGGWRVVSNRAARRFGGDADPQTIARELRVDHVLSGTLLRGGNRVRATLQLVAAKDAAVVWSHTVECTADDVLDLQEAICRDAVAAVAAVAVPDASSANRPTAPPGP